MVDRDPPRAQHVDARTPVGHSGDGHPPVRVTSRRSRAPAPCDTPPVEGLLSIAQRSPRRSFAAGDVVLVDGGAVEGLYVLLDGTLRVEKAGVTIATISQ